jgi:CubicO group peptidase (beta-lactamase class C family)
MKKIFPLFLLICWTYAAKSQQVQAIDSLMKEAYSRRIFNGNVLVSQRGKIIYQRSFGYADGQRATRLTSALKFDIGSISKEFNGVAIMQLKEKGKLSLEDPVAKYFPEFGPWAKEVRISHLINYTSGIPVSAGAANDNDSLIYRRLLELKTLTAAPGSVYIYNHINVYLQRRIIEKCSGLSYADYVAKNLLLPAGMKATSIDYPVTAPGMAQAFDNEGQPAPYQQHMTGWVRLTINDFLKWANALHRGKLINKVSFRELGRNFPGGESSLGSTEFRNDTLIWHQHQGSNSNYEAAIYSYLPEDITIILMTNNQQMKVLPLKTAIMNILQDRPFTIPKKSLYLSIRDKMLANVDEGIRYYQTLKANGQEHYDFSFEVGDLVSAAKYLQRRDKFAEAVRVLQLAVALPANPKDISYAYELIGDCNRLMNKKAEAIENYRKAIEVFSENSNAQGLLRQLEN